ncbi:MAG: tetratricopeptide repeat protein [Myxococcales bacterium]|jgi:tetratricopeptide (TPR) repeat protein|nr:tetratricopeptide repeat protein [Myxococcales bacterium]
MSRLFRVLLLVLPLSSWAGCASTPNTTSSTARGKETDLMRVERLIRDKQLVEAMGAARQLLAREPDSSDAMRLFVEAAFRGGQIIPALDELSAKIAVEPGRANLHYGKGIGLYAQSAAQETSALEHLNQAAQLSPYVAEYFFRIGLIHLDAERFEEAMTALARARDLDRDQSRHHISLAQAQARTGDRQGALDSLRAVLDLSPRGTDLEVAQQVISKLNMPFREIPKIVAEEFERGLNYMQHDAPQQAMVTFQEILQKFPDLAAVHAALGLCFQRIDDASRAMEEFRYAIELSPKDPLNHLYLANLYFSKERYDRATASYRTVIEQDPLNVHAYERLGQMAVQVSDFATAAMWLKRLITLRPKDLMARLSYGAVLGNQEKFAEAEAVFQKLLDEDGKNVEVLMRLGLLYWERRKREEFNPENARRLAEKAAGYFEKVLDLQPQNVMAARMLQDLSKQR